MDALLQLNWLQALGWAVLNSFWQMALLWVLYQVLQRSISFKSTQKNDLAAILLIAGFIWFLITAFSASLFITKDYTSSIFVNNNNMLLSNNIFKPVLAGLSAIYLALLFFPLAKYVRDYRFVKKISTQGLSRVDVQWRLYVNNVSEQLGIREKVKVWFSSIVESPVTIGFFKPIILLPIATINQLSPDQVEAILLHELSHIRRHDYLLNLFTRFVQAILYFNPFVKAFIKIIETEREKSCDEMVMQFQYDPYKYAEALLILERKEKTSQAMAVVGRAEKNELLRRVEWILGVKQQPNYSLKKSCFVFTFLLFGFCLQFFSKQTIQKQGLFATTFKKASTAPNFAKQPIDDSKNQEQFGVLLFAEKKNNFNSKSPLLNQDSKSSNKILNRSIIVPAPLVQSPNNSQILWAGFQLPKPLTKAKLEFVAKTVLQVQEAAKEIQWKKMEANLGELVNTQEKEFLKDAYIKKKDQAEMDKWEHDLGKAYDQINWDKINYELKTAVANLQIDSLQKMYNIAIGNLNNIQYQLQLDSLTGIPDTEISLYTIEKKKLTFQKMLDTLKTIKAKPIIRL